MGCYFLGGFARLFDSDAIRNGQGGIVYDAIIPTMLNSLSDILIGIVIVLVLSASMSTLSSLVLTSSSTLTLDFLKGNIIKKMDEKKQLLTMRIFLVFFVVISVVIALDPPTFIAQLMGISWGACRCVLSAFHVRTVLEGRDEIRCLASFICGVGITVSNMFFHFIASPINAGAIAMVAGLIVVPVVSLITPKLSGDKVNEIFECYEEKNTVEQKLVLTDEEEKCEK